MAKIITTKAQNEFLTKEGIYFEWLENVTKRYTDEDEDIDFTKQDSRFISSSFIWVNTPQGHDFWEDYDYKFAKFLNK